MGYHYNFNCLIAQSALVMLVCQFAPRCVAAEAASPPPPAATATNLAGSAAELAWQQLQKALRAPPPPASWRTNSPTQEEREAFNKRNGELAAQVADMASEFYTRFPDHPKAQEARQRELEMRKTAVQLGNDKQVARLNELQDARAKDTTTEPEEPFLLRWKSIEREALKSGAGSPGYFDEVQKGLFTLRTEFPDRMQVCELMLQLLQIRSDAGEADKARALAQGLIQSSIPEETKESVRRMIRKFDFLGKPIQLKFTAVDGREVDLEKMRGKVVLLDFWASWCGPCMAEIPKLRSAYEKLHAKGFEIIGINMDEDKAQMQRVLTSARMTWPQCFDGQRWDGPLARQFGIMSIPALWLIDKRGVLVDLKGEPNLEEKVEKLLKEDADAVFIRVHP
jgi:thiol-disulfide isomerase/thioredoxin